MEMEQQQPLGTERGCGASRTKGGIYVEVPVGPVGIPWYTFLVDPPIPVEPSAMGLAARGVTLKPRGGPDGVYDIWDWVGSQFYPNVADFLEEGIRLGFSRRVSRQADFARLDSRSRLCLVHSRAFFTPVRPYYVAPPVETFFACPKQLVDHIHPDTRQFCAGLWWRDLDPATCEAVLDPAVPYRTVTRSLPAFTYTARRRPDDARPRYQPALFMVLPIPKLVVIADREGGTHREALAKARQAKLPVVVEES